MGPTGYRYKATERPKSMDAAASAAFSEVGREPLGMLPADEGQRVDLAAVLQHFEVDVRAGGTAGGTHVSQGIATRHSVAEAHREALVVAIAGDEAVAMAHLDEVSVACLLTRKRHDARRHGDHVGALRAREID